MRNVNHKLILQAHILLKSFLSKFLNSFYFLLFQASVHFHPSNFLSSFLPTCDGITNETVGMCIQVWVYLFQRKVYTDAGTYIHTYASNFEFRLEKPMTFLTEMTFLKKGLRKMLLYISFILHSIHVKFGFVISTFFLK